MFIKFTIILVIVYLLFKGALKIYIGSLDYIQKYRISLKKYTNKEFLAFLTLGLIHLITYVCVIISAGILVWELI